ncbi:MAG: DUF1013 domain-containing protein [Holosporales bacterium]|jgi:hypothetical protein|nr:DUF1013 domain-containing protein [Holosporales bacterium]
MNLPLMPRATAIWLVEHTSLTFAQIADFCGLHMLEVESIADGETESCMIGFDPIVSSQLTMEEIKRCEADPQTSLKLNFNPHLEEIRSKRTSAKYTPRSKRQDKPDAIAWIIKYYPEMPESDICNLIGTTKSTIKMIRNKTYKNFAKIVAKSPVVLGLSSEAELDFVIAKLSRE